MSAVRLGRWVNDPVTNAQLNFIRSLAQRTGEQVDLHSILTKGQATRTIDWLKSKPVRSPSMQPKMVDSILPKSMLNSIPAGRYAVRTTDGTDWVFFRVSDVKSGTYPGTRKIQTQHGPDLYTRLQWYPDSGAVVKESTMPLKGSSVKELLIYLVSDTRTAARAYGRELGRCCRCGCELTADSKKYGIGPECEKHWPWVKAAYFEEQEAGMA